MKKLTILIAMLMATSAWANDIFDDLATKNTTKHLDCPYEIKGESHDMRIAFDPSDGSDDFDFDSGGEATKEIWSNKNGVKSCTSVPCISVGVFTKTENLYEFVWKFSIFEEHLILNRKDLTYTHQIIAYDSSDYFSTEYGSCKVVQRATKKNKI